MRQREFITVIGVAAATWSVVGHAQQRIEPLVGILCAGTAQALERYLASLREGMRQLGYVEGSSVYRWPPTFQVGR
jgi:putative ABC transport system substrate-binding protein